MFSIKIPNKTTIAPAVWLLQHSVATLQWTFHNKTMMWSVQRDYISSLHSDTVFFVEFEVWLEKLLNTSMQRVWPGWPFFMVDLFWKPPYTHSHSEGTSDHVSNEIRKSTLPGSLTETAVKPGEHTPLESGSTAQISILLSLIRQT